MSAESAESHSRTIVVLQPPLALPYHMDTAAETIKQLKQELSESYPLQPCKVESQRLLHEGRILEDSELLGSLRAPGPTLTLHLALRPAGSSPLPSYLLPPFASPAFPFGASYAPLSVPVIPTASTSMPHIPSSQLSPQVHPPALAPGPAPAPAHAANAPAAAAPAPAQPQQRRRGIWFFINVQLALRLGLFVWLFSDDDEPGRFLVLCAAALAIYIFQVLIFPGGGAEAGDEEEVDEQLLEQLAAQERQAQEENAHGPADPAQEQELNQEQEQEHGQGEDGQPVPRPQAQEEQVHLQPQPQRQFSFLVAAERFVVGILASLVPAWRPRLAAA